MGALGVADRPTCARRVFRVVVGGGGGSGFGTGLTQGGQSGDGEVTISWTVQPGCAPAPPAAAAVTAAPTFTG